MTLPAQPPAPGVRKAPEAPMRAPTNLRPLQFLLLLYIALWVFEGALRKWIVPGLANPLLIVRDPVLLMLYALAAGKGLFPTRPLVVWTIFLAVFALAVSIVANDIPMLIQLYGLRADYLHLPLIFLMPMLFDRDDIRLVGKGILLLGAPMAALVLLQFVSPPSGFLNRGAGGGDGGQLESAYGHIRPSGTFSFTNGLTGFSLLVAAFFLHHLLERRVYPKWLWLATGPALVVLITLSGSRVAVGLAGLLMVTVVFICLLKPRYWGSALSLIVIGMLAATVLGSLAVFQSGLQVFAYRFGNSENVRLGFFGRFLESLAEPFETLKYVGPGGLGLGMGTNVAGALMTGKRTFLLAEGEWPRVLMESGPYAGGAFIILRGAITAVLGVASLASLRRDANTLPLLIFAGCFLDILQGQFAQPTGLGYAVIAGGLCLAACRMPVAAAVVAPTAEAVALPAPGIGARSLTRRPMVPPAPVVEVPTASKPVAAVSGRRGRSIYAERLHQADENDDQDPRPNDQ